MIKIHMLKKQNVHYEQGLFEECMDVFGSDVIILSSEETEKVRNLFEQVVSIHHGLCRIDWKNVTKKSKVDDPEQIIPALKKLLKKQIDYTVYVLWNDADLPAIKVDIRLALEHLECIVSLGKESWLYNPSNAYIVEFYRNNINLGLFPLN